MNILSLGKISLCVVFQRGGTPKKMAPFFFGRVSLEVFFGRIPKKFFQKKTLELRICLFLEFFFGRGFVPKTQRSVFFLEGFVVRSSKYYFQKNILNITKPAFFQKKFLSSFFFHHKLEGSFRSYFFLQYNYYWESFYFAIHFNLYIVDSWKLNALPSYEIFL